MNDLEIAKKYISLQSSAKNRGKEFTLTFAELKKVLNRKTCFFTGVKFDKGLLCRSIDRLDNNKGYVYSNVVVCTQRINSLKNNLTLFEISSIYNKLKKKGLL